MSRREKRLAHNQTIREQNAAHYQAMADNPGKYPSGNGGTQVMSPRGASTSTTETKVRWKPERLKLLASYICTDTVRPLHIAVVDGNKLMSESERQQYAEFIVRAVNSHADMLEALEASVEIIDALLLGQIPEKHRYSETSRAATVLHDAIAKARGGAA